MSTLEDLRNFAAEAMEDKEGLVEINGDFGSMPDRMQLAFVCGLWLCKELYKLQVPIKQIDSVAVLYGMHAVRNDPIALAASYLDQTKSRQEITEWDVISNN